MRPILRAAFFITVTGRVQRVGFRAFVRRTAMDLSLHGWVRNRSDGSVEILAIGTPASIDHLHQACHLGPPSSRPERVEIRDAADDGTEGFHEKETL